MANISWKKVGGGDFHNFTETPELVGKFVDMIPADKAARKSSIITLEDENGKPVKFWGSTVLDSHFQTIHQGETVKVFFRGLSKSQTGVEYKNYEVWREDTPAV